MKRLIMILCLGVAALSRAGIMEEALATGEEKPYVADPVAAEKAYFRGAKAQAKHQWADAIKEYQAALDADHDYAWANKGLGTTYLEAGDKWAALTNYEKYLSANPDDAPLRSFVNKLRVELGESPVVIALATPTPEGDTKTPWTFSAGLGGLLAGADDLNNLSGSGGAKYGGALALGLDASADFQVTPDYFGSARIILGPNRSHSTDGANKTTTDINNFGIFVAPGMKLPINGYDWWDLRVGVGYISSAVTSTTNLGGSNVVRTLAGTGFGLWPEAGYARMFDKSFGGMVSLGYLISSESVTDSTGKAFSLSTGGFSVRLGATFHL